MGIGSPQDILARNIEEGEQTMTENWKAVAGYEGLYEVSDEGNVRSLKYGREKIMKPGKNGGGYLQVILCKDGQQKHLLVHRLVAEAFVPNPNNLETVNHKDEVKTNNTASNLEWMTQADNNRYGTRTARCSKPVQMFDKSTGKLLATFPSIMEAERITGIANSHICYCCNGKYKSAGGYIWRYEK